MSSTSDVPSSGNVHSNTSGQIQTNIGESHTTAPPAMADANPGANPAANLPAARATSNAASAASQDIDMVDTDQPSQQNEDEFSTEFKPILAPRYVPLFHQTSWRSWNIHRRQEYARSTVSRNRAVLSTSDRASRSSEATEMIKIMGLLPKQPIREASGDKWVTLVRADTLMAASALFKENMDPATKDLPSDSRLAILNFADQSRPGGGFMSGFAAQEESLCARTTLYHSLCVKADWYKPSLPAATILYSPDVLVTSLAVGRELKNEERFHVDVISCSATKKPKLQKQQNGEMTYLDGDTATIMARDITGILRAAIAKNVKWLVLGAIGCGYYSHPPKQVAIIMRNCLLRAEADEDFRAQGLECVVIAILDNPVVEEIWSPFVEIFRQSDEVTVDHTGQIFMKKYLGI